MRIMIGLAIVVALLAAGPALAQPDDHRSHWGVAVSFNPSWQGSDRVKILFDAESTDLKGGEFMIGVARGRTYGGDWSVSLVRKQFKEGSLVDRGGTSCYTASLCGTFGTQLVAGSGVTLLGVEGSKYLNFGTIARRAQIGLVIGGGVGSMRGTVLRRVSSFQPTVFDHGVPVAGVQQVTETTDAARTVFVEQLQDYVPLFRAELAVGAIVAPGVKLRVTGGITFPGYHRFGVSCIYLIGG